MLLGVGPLAAAELRMASGPGKAGPLRWQAIEFVYRTASESASGWAAVISQPSVELPSQSPYGLHSIRLDCPGSVLGSGSDRLPACSSGRMSWQTLSGESHEAALDLLTDGSGTTIQLRATGVEIEGRWSGEAARIQGLSARLDAFELRALLPMLKPWVDLDLLYGQITGRLALEDGVIAGQWQIRSAGFDGQEGAIAGDGLDLDLDLSARMEDDLPRIDLGLIQSAGELLFGSLYLPSPSEPIELSAGLVQRDATSWRLQDLRYDSPGVLRLGAEAVLVREGDAADGGQDDLQAMGWRLNSARLNELDVDLARAWPRWVNGFAAAAGFADLQAQGRLRASGRASSAQGVALDLAFEDFELSDPRGRFSIAPSAGTLTRADDESRLELVLSGFELYGLPFGSTRVLAEERDQRWRLSRTLRMPLLDGAVVIDRFQLQTDSEQLVVTLDAGIEPLSLERLTETLGWPRFGGQLAGDFPGIEFSGDRLDVTGAIQVDAFSGRVRLDGLSVERPFGTLPAVAAQVQIERLDLLELTGAFNFGRMEGQVSGWMKDLRLLDWQPVAMDTRLFTHEDVPRRRISQRAVDNLSNLGGGFGGALIGNTVLSVFEDFPYRRAGLACRLSNNICYVDGVAPHDSGGFYIVEGRGLPRLDIIGHRRLVDWPQLLEQLAAATR
jgi:hypothetical protein